MKFAFPYVSARALARTAFVFSVFTATIATSVIVMPAPATAIATFGGIGRNGFEPSTNPSTAQYANRGWQYLGLWGQSVGTVIAPNYFITAAHLPGPQHDLGSSFIFDGVSYATIASTVIPGTDLRLFKIDGTLPRYAQLYTGSDETTGGAGGLGKELFVAGRGPGRGDANGNHGWYGGGYPDGQLGTISWGTNNITDVAETGGGPGSEYLYFTFDQGQGDNEAGVLSGDSGSAVFLQQDGVWKLGGTIFGVDGFFSNVPDPTPAERFLGSFYDTRGLYAEQLNPNQTDPNLPNYTIFVLVTGDNPVPSGSYATRISANVAKIDAITGLNSFAVVPEPSTLALLASASVVGAVGVIRRRKRRAN